MNCKNKLHRSKWTHTFSWFEHRSQNPITVKTTRAARLLSTDDLGVTLKLETQNSIAKRGVRSGARARGHSRPRCKRLKRRSLKSRHPRFPVLLTTKETVGCPLSAGAPALCAPINRCHFNGDAGNYRNFDTPA